MSQQVNLFNPVFLKQKKHFSALTMLQALGLILLGAVALSAFANYSLSRLRKDAAATSVQLQAAKNQLSLINAEYAPERKSKALEEEVRKLEAEMKSMQQVFDTLRNGDFGNTKGYSEYLRAFSRQIVSGVWLTGFSIHGAGNDIQIQGRALKPEMVPSYVSRLKNEPIMQGKSFATLEMQQPNVDRAGSKQDNPAQVAARQRTFVEYIEFNLKSSGIVDEKSAPAGANSK